MRYLLSHLFLALCSSFFIVTIYSAVENEDTKQYINPNTHKIYQQLENIFLNNKHFYISRVYNETGSGDDWNRLHLLPCNKEDRKCMNILELYKQKKVSIQSFVQIPRSNTDKQIGNALVQPNKKYFNTFSILSELNQNDTQEVDSRKVNELNPALLPDYSPSPTLHHTNSHLHGDDSAGNIDNIDDILWLQLELELKSKIQEILGDVNSQRSLYQEMDDNQTRTQTQTQLQKQLQLEADGELNKNRNIDVANMDEMHAIFGDKITNCIQIIVFSPTEILSDSEDVEKEIEKGIDRNLSQSNLISLLDIFNSVEAVKVSNTENYLNSTDLSQFPRPSQPTQLTQPTQPTQPIQPSETSETLQKDDLIILFINFDISPPILRDDKNINDRIIDTVSQINQNALIESNNNAHSTASQSLDLLKNLNLKQVNTLQRPVVEFRTFFQKQQQQLKKRLFKVLQKSTVKTDDTKDILQEQEKEFEEKVIEKLHQQQNKEDEAEEDDEREEGERKEQGIEEEHRIHKIVNLLQAGLATKSGSTQASGRSTAQYRESQLSESLFRDRQDADMMRNHSGLIAIIQRNSTLTTNDEVTIMNSEMAKSQRFTTPTEERFEEYSYKDRLLDIQRTTRTIVPIIYETSPATSYQAVDPRRNRQVVDVERNLSRFGPA